MKLRTKIIVGLVAFSLFCTLPLLALFLTKDKEMRKATYDRAHDIAASLNDKIERNLFERYGDIQAFAANTAAYDPANWNNPSGPLVAAINSYMVNYGIYKLSLYVDLEGNTRAVNSVDSLGKEIDTSSYYGANFAETNWFKNVKEGKFLEGRDGLTGTYVEGPYRDETINTLYGTTSRVLVFAAQVKDSSGKVIGYWANFATFELVDAIMQATADDLKKNGLERIDILMLDDQGNVINDLEIYGDKITADVAVKAKTNLVTLKYPPALEALAEKSGSLVSPHYENPDVKKLVGFDHSDGAYSYPGLGWSLLIEFACDEAFASINSAIFDMELAIGIIIAVSTIIAYFIGAAFSRPINKMTETMRLLAEGDISVEIPSTDNKDEIGDMAKAVLVFKENMQQTEKLKQEQEAQKKRSEEEKKQSMNRMADGFESSVKSVVTGVSASAEQMRGNAERLSVLAGETKSTSTTVAASATEAAQTATQVAAAAEELTAAIGEISSQVQKSSTVANQASQQAENINQSMHSLVEKSNRVGEVIQFITNIASQINLLALNATIESARAGEAGRGFAVVASEVKNLANQTAKATEEIVQQVQSMQEATQGAVQSVGEIIQIISEISAATAGVAAAVEEQSAATNEISRNIAHTASGTNEISRNIVNVEKGADETGTSSRQVLDSAKVLSEQATVLSEKVDEFLRMVRAS